MKELFDSVSFEVSELTTKRYSTSFSLGISFLSKEIQRPIYSLYGFVRLADEIVDSFHDYPKEKMLTEFRAQTFQAIERFFCAINSTLSLHLLHYLHVTSNAKLPTYLIRKRHQIRHPSI